MLTKLVGSSHPGKVGNTKGSTVRRLKWYVSWVQNVDNTALIYGNINLALAISVEPS